MAPDLIPYPMLVLQSWLLPSFVSATVLALSTVAQIVQSGSKQLPPGGDVTVNDSDAPPARPANGVLTTTDCAGSNTVLVVKGPAGAALRFAMVTRACVTHVPGPPGQLTLRIAMSCTVRSGCPGGGVLRGARSRICSMWMPLCWSAMPSLTVAVL